MKITKELERQEKLAAAEAIGHQRWGGTATAHQALEGRRGLNGGVPVVGVGWGNPHVPLEENCVCKVYWSLCFHVYWAFRERWRSGLCSYCIRKRSCQHLRRWILHDIVFRDSLLMVIVGMNVSLCRIECNGVMWNGNFWRPHGITRVLQFLNFLPTWHATLSRVSVHPS